MDVVTLGMAKADAAKKYGAAAIAASRFPVVPGIQVTDVTYLTGPASWGNQTTAGTSRMPYMFAADCTDVRLTFINHFTNGTGESPFFNDIDASSPLPVKASWEVGGVLYPVTFKGLLTGTVDPGGFITSDPLPIDFTKGQVAYLRTYTSSTSWRANRISYHSTGMGGFLAGDHTPKGSGAIAENMGKLLAPALITGTPRDKAMRSVLGVGDSIANGSGDDLGGSFGTYMTTNEWQGGGGFINRALRGKVGYASIAVPGDQAQNFVALESNIRRLMLSSQFTDAICEYGRNDITNARTLPQLQANLLTIWNKLAIRGLRVWQTTITPSSTSNNGWRDQAGQTGGMYGSSHTVRVDLNRWIRAGAPIVAGAAVAVGTVGALLAGQSGHPLYGYFEAANTIESPVESGYWKPANRVVTDAVMTVGPYTVTSATAAFTSADVGRMIAVMGAGPGGGILYTLIQSVASATLANLLSTASVAVSGASMGIGTGTSDGLHPNSEFTKLMAAGIDPLRILAN